MGGRGDQRIVKERSCVDALALFTLFALLLGVLTFMDILLGI